MFVDARQIGDSAHFQYDICIVGAGAAGIAFALEFEGLRDRICVLESGGFEIDEATQSLYQGENIGFSYDPLDSARLRYFGGTTNHWAGYCLPLAAYSFERRSWVPHSGWPITRAELSPYYDRAHKLLGLPKTGWSPDSGWSADVWERKYGDPRLPLESDPFTHNALCIRPVRMGEDFRERLDLAANIDIYLNANLASIDLTSNGGSVDRYTVRTLEGKKFTFSARYFVLAAGGIENARLLLASNDVQSNGVGNQNDLVGRFFADHLNVASGYWVPSNPGLNIELYQQRWLEGSEAVVWHEVSNEDQAKHKLVPASIRLIRDQRSRSRGESSVGRIKRDLREGRISKDLGQHLANIALDIGPLATETAELLWYGRRPAQQIDFEMSLAPAPNKDSRVTLGNDVDALGMRRVALDWKLSEIDSHTVRWVTETFASVVAASGLGRSRLAYDEASISDLFFHTWHHMCTTRMADNPGEGVVDRDCRVYGVENQFIAGSSVFSTSGWGSPTMLIIALAQRLADKLKGELRA